MGFGFTQRKDVEAQVQRIVAEQVEKALAECRDDANFGKTVHRLRRRCKKLRGLLRLVEPRFDGFSRENRALRDAANGLSGARDAEVMIETFAALLAFDRQREGEPRISAAQAEQVGTLIERGGERLPDESERRQLLEAYARIVEAVGRRSKTWSVRKRGFESLAGFEQTYRRMAEGLETARSEGTGEALHECRKHIKYHWQHVTLLRGTAPELLRGRTSLLNDMGELLGDHHNLHVLDEKLAGQTAEIGLGEVAMLRAVIAERQAIIAERAFVLGRQLTAEKPGTLRRRFEQYWQLLPDEA